MNRRAAAAWLLPAALFAFSLLLYANSLPNGFALDDAVAIGDNPLIRDLGNVATLFVSDYWEPYLETGLYRPLITTSYALNYAVGALDPFGYHAVNVALHAAVAVLVLLLYREVAKDDLAASLAAFLFAAHAIHTEAVANVVGRAELASAAFAVAALLLYIRAQSDRDDTTRLYVMSGALYGLALLCKENAITLIGILVLHDFTFATSGWSAAAVRERLRRPYIGYLAVTGGYLLVRWLVLRTGDTDPVNALDNPLAGLDSPWNTLNALMAALRYVGLLVFPSNLSHDYSPGAVELIESGGDLRWVAVLAASAAIIATLPLAYRASRPLFFALGFSFVTFSIVSNLVLPIGTMMGERLMYLPSVGFCLAAVLAGRLLIDRLPIPRRAAAGLFVGFFCLVIAGNAWRTFARNSDWRSDVTLNEAALALGTGSAKVHYNTAWIRFVEEQRFEDAVHHARRAVEAWPSHGKAYAVLGHALVRIGKPDEAREAYRQAIRFDPKDSAVYNNLGFMLLERGEDEELAVGLIERAVVLKPDNPSYLDSLGWAYYQTGTGSLEEARDLIARSLEIDDAESSGATRRAHLEEIEAALEARSD